MFFRKSRSTINKLSESKHSSECEQTTSTNSPDDYSVNYILANKDYFNTILDNRIVNNQSVTKTEITVLREAYDKAHYIRNVELELFWKRATYCFTIIAALITLTGILFSAYFKDAASSRDNNILYLIAFVAFLGTIFTILSNLITKSGEYWKRNWEFHITFLEPLFSGRLYSTHLINSDYRTSIAKATSIFFFAMYICWCVVIFIIALILFKDEPVKYSRFTWLVIFTIMSLFLIIVFFTSTKNKEQKLYISTYNIKIDNKHKIKEPTIVVLLNFIKKIIYALLAILISLFCIVFFNHGSEAFDLRFTFKEMLFLLENLLYLWR